MSLLYLRTKSVVYHYEYNRGRCWPFPTIPFKEKRNHADEWYASKAIFKSLLPLLSYNSLVTLPSTTVNTPKKIAPITGNNLTHVFEVRCHTTRDMVDIETPKL